ncbi:MAG: putative mutator protein MutT4 [Candidatus Scalindua rubra]|uniref:Putative mutator protein MutT4 n=1 Tax=Candidatus Scalindua rubra TaxID=1872076 RepID=A0A1E3XG89_9BACT|nr:MAG: putative mutator protein MutT4 [Candidatus Scalindua rubra]
MSEFTHAGGIVIRRNKGTLHYLIVTAKKNPKHWVFPKGHIIVGETPEQTAKREVLEETGVEAKILDFVNTIKFKTRDEAIMAKFYLMEYIAEKGDAEDREKRWCTYDEALDLLSFEETRDLLRQSQPLAHKLI